MAKEAGIQLDGKVIEVLGNAMFRVATDHSVVIAHVSGKIRQHDIKIILGDKVCVEFSPYDMTKGRIVRRH